MKRHRENRTVLLTLGRLPVALELARALHSHGWRVVVAEPYAWHLCRLSNSVERCFQVAAPIADKQRYLREIANIVHSENVSLVLPVSEETLYVSALRTCLPDSVDILCMHQSALLQLHDKFRFAVYARELGLPMPETLLANDRLVQEQLMAEPFVVKPRLSCSGAGVRLVAAGGILESRELNDQYIVQQRLTGDACCSFSIAAAGKTLMTLCYRSLLDSGSVSVCFEQITVPDGVRKFIDTIVLASGYSGMIAFDFIQNNAGQWSAIECNPRATSGVHFVDHTGLVSSLINKQPLTLHKLSAPRQEFWSSLAKVEGALFKGQLNRQGWKNLFKVRDITLCKSDLKPFMFMCFVLAPQLVKSIRTGKPVSEIIMSDVGWREPRP